MNFIKIILIVLGVVQLQLGFSQSDTYSQMLDSLDNRVGLATTSEDKAMALIDYVYYCYDDVVWPAYNDKAIEIIEKELLPTASPEDSNIYIMYAEALINKAFQLDQIGKQTEALFYNTKATTYAEMIGDTSLLANIWLNIGVIYKNEGLYSEALKHYFDALILQRKIDDYEGIAVSNDNIAQIFHAQNEFEKAEEYVHESMRIREEINDSLGMANNYLWLGALYHEKGTPKIAPFRKAAQLLLQNQDNLPLSYAYVWMATLHENENNYDSASYFYHKSLRLRIKIQHLYSLSANYISMSKFFQKNNQLDSAIYYGKLAYEITEEQTFNEKRKESAAALAEAYSLKGDFKEALAYQKVKVALKDSVLHDLKSKEIGKLEGKYEFAKQQAESAKEQREKELLQEQIRNRKNNLQYSGILVLVLILFAAIFMLGRFKMSDKLAEGTIFFTFLLFFEFILVLVDPWVDMVTNQTPIYKLIINAGIAFVIFPLHDFFERTIKKNILQK